MKSQLRFAKHISDEVTRVSKKQKTRSNDLPLSDEMSSWLRESVTATDENEYLVDTVGSVLAQPMDSFSLYCPAGSLIKSRFAASKMPDKSEKDPRTWSFDMSTSLSETAFQPQRKINFDAAVSRLDVMWLQRKSKIEQEEGNLQAAIDTLNEAVRCHIGPKSYEEAKLAETVSATDPEDMFTQIQEDYFAYDSTAHNFADRIQRWFHRHYIKKCRAANTIASAYVYYRYRKAKWMRHKIWTENAVKIQRCFRSHLLRMHNLATKIKSWYLLQCGMRDFRKRLFIYQMARRVQRLFRGNKGRLRAAIARWRRDMAMRIQRNCRGFVIRWRRSFAIKQFHRVYFKAALRIQALARRVNAAAYCKYKLVQELLREEVRMQREQAIHDEIIQIEMSRTKLYINTVPGKLHLAAAKQKILAKDEEYAKIEPALSDDDVLAHDAMVTFELYDVDGSGSIDHSELSLMLRELCIVMTDDKVAELAKQLDSDNSGEIDFDEFLQWFLNGGSDTGGQSMGAALFQQMLRARRLVMDLTGQTLARRAQREVLRQCCSYLVTETKTLFRLSCPPKYNCCRCLQPFVLFADYFNHFDKNYCCVITGEKAIFYPRFWLQHDWLKQRMCEREIMRVKDEFPYLSHKAQLACYEELSLQSDPGMVSLIKGQIDAAIIMYTEILSNSCDEAGNYEKSIAQHIYDIANICNDGYLSPNVVKAISECLQKKIPNDWILEDRWTLYELESWLEMVCAVPVLNERAPKCWAKTKSKMQKLHCCDSEARKIRKKIKRDATLLGTIYVRSLRVLQVGAETSMLALKDYRQKKPRRMAIPDKELEAKDLYVLTSTSYRDVSNQIVNRLSIIRDALRKLLLISVNSRQKTWLDSVKDCFGIGYARIVQFEDPTEEDLEDMAYRDAHIRANAHFQKRMGTRVGKVHIRRLSCELWARRRVIDTEIEQNKNQANAKLLGDIKYIYELFTSSALRDGIHLQDVDILFSDVLSIDIDLEHFGNALQSLDPRHTGLISFEQLSNWILAGNIQMYKNNRLFIRNMLKKCWRLLTFTRFQDDAKLQVLLDLRKLARLELDMQKAALSILTQSYAKINSLADSAATHSSSAKMLKAMPSTRNVRLPESSRASIRRHLDASETSHAGMKLQSLYRAFHLREQSVLVRMAEEDAEWNCKLNMLFSWKGQSAIFGERKFMQIVASMIQAYGEAVETTLPFPNSQSQLENAGFKLCLCVLIYAFDTDCSGSFDESEIRLLLQCTRNALHEKQLLYYFPDVLTGASSIQQILNYLLNKVYWRRGTCGKSGSISVSTLSCFKSAQLMLISQARQAARERANQAAQLTKTGVLDDIDSILPPENGQAVLFRSQMFAMRQVYSYLCTDFGRIRQQANEHNLQIIWRGVVSSGFSKESLLFYAISIHFEPSTGINRMLNTELPHLLHYLVDEFGWRTNTAATVICASIYKIHNKKDIQWMTGSELESVLWSYFAATEPCWHVKTKYTAPSRFHKDAKLRMLAVARQQAVLVSMGFPDINVAETNHRCFILGLMYHLRLNEQVFDDRVIDWTSVPKETVDLFILSQGLSMTDLVYLMKCCKADEQGVRVDAEFGTMIVQPYDSVGETNINPQDALDYAMQRIFSRLNFFDSFDRIIRYFGGGSKFSLYKRMVKALKMQKDSVNDAGRIFLNELILCVSHCSAAK